METNLEKMIGSDASSVPNFDATVGLNRTGSGIEGVPLSAATTGSLLSSVSLIETPASRPIQTASDLVVPNFVGIAEASAPNAPDLVVRFRDIILPDSTDFGDDGQVTLRIRNTGPNDFLGPVTVNLYISTDDNIDLNSDGSLRNDALLTSFTSDTFAVRAGRSQTLTLDYDNITSVIAHGSYHLIAEVVTPDLVERDETNNVAVAQVSAPGTDQVLEWNAIALNAIQELGETSSGVGPTVGSRLMAIASAAVFDTVNAFSHTYESYLVDRNAPVGASLEAAVVGAAHRVLTTLLPEQKDFFDQQLRQSRRDIQDTPIAEVLGVQFGRQIANAVLAARQGDGSENNSPYVPPIPGIGDPNYVWRPEIGNPFALSPNWGNVTPFGITSRSDFAPDGLFGRPGTGNAARDQRYIQEIEEVRQFGAREDTALTTVLRTADQTEQALFWAYDRPDTFRPYGHLNQIAQQIALTEANTLEDNSRLFALLNIALADAAIVAWGAKYEETQPRPDDVIFGDGRTAFAAIDGFNQTVFDPDWRPFFEQDSLIGEGSPPFPDYISGHATFGGAFAGVLETIYGIGYEFETISQEVIGSVRSFDRFRSAGLEDANSRLYGGVHVREANEDGNISGFTIGNYIASNLLQAV